MPDHLLFRMDCTFAIRIFTQCGSLLLIKCILLWHSTANFRNYFLGVRLLVQKIHFLTICTEDFFFIAEKSVFVASGNFLLKKKSEIEIEKFLIFFPNFDFCQKKISTYPGFASFASRVGTGRTKNQTFCFLVCTRISASWCSLYWNTIILML